MQERRGSVQRIAQPGEGTVKRLAEIADIGLGMRQRGIEASSGEETLLKQVPGIERTQLRRPVTFEGEGGQTGEIRLILDLKGQTVFLRALPPA